MQNLTQKYRVQNAWSVLFLYNTSRNVTGGIQGAIKTHSTPFCADNLIRNDEDPLAPNNFERINIS